MGQPIVHQVPHPDSEDVPDSENPVGDENIQTMEQACECQHVGRDCADESELKPKKCKPSSKRFLKRWNGALTRWNGNTTRFKEMEQYKVETGQYKVEMEQYKVEMAQYKVEMAQYKVEAEQQGQVIHKIMASMNDDRRKISKDAATADANARRIMENAATTNKFYSVESLGQQVP